MTISYFSWSGLAIKIDYKVRSYAVPAVKKNNIISFNFRFLRTKNVWKTIIQREKWDFYEKQNFE